MSKLYSSLTLLAFVIVGTGLFILLDPLNRQVTGQVSTCQIAGWAWGGEGGPGEVFCSLSVNPSSVYVGAPSTLTWGSQNASFAMLQPGNITLNPPSGGSIAVTPLETTSYTATFTGPAGEAVCETSLEVIVEPLGPPRNLTCTPIAPVGGTSWWRMQLNWDPPLEIPSYGFDYYVLFRYPPYHTLQCFDPDGYPITCPTTIENAYGLFEVEGPPGFLPHHYIDPLDIIWGTTYYYAMVAAAVEETGPNQIVIQNISDYSNTAVCNPNGVPEGDCPPWGCTDGDGTGPGDDGTGPGGTGPGDGPGDGIGIGGSKPVCDVELLCCATCEDYGFGGGDIQNQINGCICTPNNSPMGGIRIDCPGSPPDFACDPCLDFNCPK